MNIKQFVGVDAFHRLPNGLKLSHTEFYDKVIEKLGGMYAIIPYIPFTFEEIKEALSKDKHLNNLPISRWDIGSTNIVTLYRSYGINCYSLSDGTSLLKRSATLWVWLEINEDWEKTFEYDLEESED